MLPRDREGRELRIGDVVQLRCRVVEVFPQRAGHNVTLTAIDGPEDEYRPTIRCHSRSGVRDDESSPNRC